LSTVGFAENSAKLSTRTRQPQRQINKLLNYGGLHYPEYPSQTPICHQICHQETGELKRKCALDVDDDAGLRIPCLNSGSRTRQSD
jgi:hypothetical protein